MTDALPLPKYVFLVTVEDEWPVTAVCVESGAVTAVQSAPMQRGALGAPQVRARVRRRVMPA